MTINIEYEVENSFDFDADEVIKAVVNEALDYENAHTRLLLRLL